MKNRLVSIAIGLFVVSCSTVPRSSAPSLGETGTIQGTVMLEENGLPGVAVIATMRSVSRSAITDVDGKFQIKDLPPGRYQVRFELESTAGDPQTAFVVKSQSVGLTEPMRLTAPTSICTITASAPAVLKEEEHAPSSRGGSRPRGVVSANRQPSTVGKAETNPENGYNVAASQPIATFDLDFQQTPPAGEPFQAGSLAPSVGTEEIVNYFTYSYPRPPGDAPQTLTTEVSVCPWSPSHLLAQIGVQVRDRDEWRAVPNNLVFLLDVSRSMEQPARLPLLELGLQHLAERLRPQDSIAIVVYGDVSGVVLPPTPGSHQQTIVAALKKLRAGGSTTKGKGIELAYRIAEENFQKSGNNRVILATDGDLDVGTASVDTLEELVEQKKKGEIYMTTIGVGAYTDQFDTMDDLADQGNGTFEYVPDLEEAQKVFSREFRSAGADSTSARISVIFDPERVAFYREIGYEPVRSHDFQGREGRFLGAGHSATALYEIIPSSNEKSGGRIGHVELRYFPSNNRSIERMSMGFQNAPMTDQRKDVSHASADMQLAAAVAEFGMLRRSSYYKGISSYGYIIDLLRMSQGPRPDAHRQQFLELVEALRGVDKDCR